MKNINSVPKAHHHLSLVISHWSLLLLLLLGLCSAATAVSVEPRIADIQIEGNKAVAEQEIMNVIFSRVGENLFQAKIQSDIKAIYSLGFFDDVTADFKPVSGGTKVIFKIVENPVIKGIYFEGNTVYSTAELSGLISSETGQILNFKKLQRDIDQINIRYKDGGYILARVVNVETNELDNTLHFKITEGVVESITLDGNDATHDYVIMREIRTKPGEVLSQEKLKKDLRRVFNLGFFSEVNPVFEPGTTPDKVVIVLKITETRTSSVNFGGGYGEQEGWFGFMDLSINNLMGTAQGLMIRGQSGSSASSYQLKYTNPWLLPDKLGDHASFTARRWYTKGRDFYESNQDAIYNGFDLSLGKPINDEVSYAWTLGSELVSPFGTSTIEGYQADTLGYTLSYDTRDFWLNPTAGRYYTFGVKQGWKMAAVNSNFFKLSWDLNHYFPVMENHVLAHHIGAGIGFADIPIGEEFWAGGANTVRGYWITDAQRGKRKLISNIEYRLNFSEMFQGVFFYDWGSAWNAGMPDFDNFLTGWGPGVRINTPLGPIRLDYGVGKGKSFSEGIMHFSIGQAF